MAHGGAPGGDKVLRALSSALTNVETDHATLYSGLVFEALPAAAREYLEGLMTTRAHEYQNEFVRRFVSRGQREGEAKAILEVLHARGIGVPDDARTRIAECRDLDQLTRWIRCAATANSADDLFRNDSM
jgi:hypothetical protein